jgi:hypothetical protein
MFGASPLTLDGSFVTAKKLGDTHIVAEMAVRRT